MKGVIEFRLLVNGADHSFMMEPDGCLRCLFPLFRANTSVSLLLIYRTKTKEELIWHELFDCGQGVVNNMLHNFRVLGYKPRIDGVIASHWHPDHTAGLNQLGAGFERFLKAANNFHPIPLWCREHTLEHLKKSHKFELGRYFTPTDILPSDTAVPGTLLPPIDLRNFGGPAEVVIQPFSISHDTAGSYSTAGFIITAPSGRRSGLVWDLDESNSWIVESPDADCNRLLHGLDVLFLDVNTWSVPGRGHSCFEGLKRHIRALSAQETVLIHLSGHEDGASNLGYGWSNAEWEVRAREHWNDLPGVASVLDVGRIRSLGVVDAPNGGK